MLKLPTSKTDSFGLQAPIGPPSGQEGAGVLGVRRLADVIWSPEAALPVDVLKNSKGLSSNDLRVFLHPLSSLPLW